MKNLTHLAFCFLDKPEPIEWMRLFHPRYQINSKLEKIQMTISGSKIKVEIATLSIGAIAYLATHAIGSSQSAQFIFTMAVMGFSRGFFLSKFK